MSSTESNVLDGIAIVGMSGRFPGAKSVQDFWRNLREGRESISFFTDDELLAEGNDPSVFTAPNYVKARGVLEDIELFDAAFFGFTPREAQVMDPQQRLFFECAWEALENAGYDPEIYRGSVGVFAGVSMSAYLPRIFSSREILEAVGSYQVLLGNDKDHLPTRVSYKLNLKGPSINVQTACSTSLVAVHLACQSLLTYQCDMALAGGVSVSVPQKGGYVYQESGIGSPDGHCRPFDQRAAGTVGGSGCGTVLLKRLSDAIADGDTIQAVIRGSAINNDGSLKVGYTAPSVEGQAEVIALAQAVAGVGPETISYVEAHGTGTRLGDPIEVAALQRAFASAQLPAGSCALGSVKSNVGHLDAAAGVTGLIKTVLALRHRELPPSLHYEKANEQIDFGATPFYVNARLKPWEAGPGRRRAGVSSFGIGGTNAHVIVEEWPREEHEFKSDGLEVVVVSARTEAALAAATAQLATHLELAAAANGSGSALADVAYTLQVGRRVFAQRRAVVCRSLQEAAAALRGESGAAGEWSGGKREVAFMFPGQGAQAVQMSRGIYEREVSYRRWVDECSEVLRGEIGVDLREILYPRAGEEAEAAAKLNETAVTQPALFVVEVGLARLWQQWGVRPGALIGHSVGELAAACVAGVLEWEPALRLVATRGRLMQSARRGAMLAVALSEAEVERWLPGTELSLAAFNSERQSVVSGATEVIDALERDLEAAGIMKRRLKTSHAFHSAMMDPVLEEFAQRVAQVKLKPPQIPFISNVTGTWITAEDATSPEYWARQMRATVRLSDGLKELMKLEHRLLLEVGPGQTLSDLAKQSSHKTAAHVIISSCGRVAKTDDEALMNGLAGLWVAGVAIDWNELHVGRSRRRVPLPTYPFERKRYWIDPPKRTLEKSTEPRRHADVADWFYTSTWKRAPAFKATLQVKGDWLLFVGRESLGHKLANRLREEGANVVTVSKGKSFARLDENEYTINSTQAGDYAALFKELNEAGRLPTRIVHLWSITPRKPRLSFRAMQEKGLYSLSLLAQTLAGYLDMKTALKHVKLDVVSNNLQDVNGDELCVPEKATLLAACNTIPYDYPQISCRSIDLATEKPASLLDQLFAELLTDTADEVVAYRHDRRWVQTLEPIRWPLAESAITCLRDEGVYVLAGEVEGVGLELAEFVAQSTQSCKLILITNKERKSFAEVVTRRLETLEKIGAEVMVDHVDLSRAGDWQRVIANTATRFGRIDGIVYLAPDSHQQLESEVSGILALESVVREVELDFCLLLSSVLNCGSAFGMFLDALAQTKNRWMSVCLAPEESSTSQRVEIFQRVLSGAGLAHVIVSPVDPRTRIEDAEKNLEQEPATETEQYARPELKTNYVAPRNEIERAIAAQWKLLLGVDRVGAHDNFFELGGHSLAGVQLTFKLREIFKTDDLHLNSLFEAPTVAGLAACVEKACAGIVTLPPLLAALQPAGSKPPFFCVHPVGGDVFGFVDLARHFAPDYPFYGIQSMGLAEIGMQGDQIIKLEDMAAEYVEAIRQVDPTGPYHVGGWSYGGNIAFEVAHQLRRMGCEVALLVLFDTPAPENFKKISQLEDVMVFLGLARERARQRGMELNITPDDLPKIKPEEQLEFISAQLKESKLAPLGLDSQYVSNFLRGFRSRMTTINNYVPQVYPGRITLFRASQRDVDMQSTFDSVSFNLSDFSLDWGRLSTEPIEVHEVEGYHELIVAEPHARLVAEAVKSCIDKNQ
jgi:acyl transferase domain-containing protein/thioesterase domain-containing protein